MARAKKERTPEQIQADRERMARVRAARQNQNPPTQNKRPIFINDELESAPEPEDSVEAEQPVEATTPSAPVTPMPDTISEPTLQELMQQIRELKENQFMLMRDALTQGSSTSTTSTVQNGKLTGTVEKYVLDPNYYPDPRKRLAEESQLKRFAFDINYELYWTVGESRYETIDHIRTVEPKFTLVLTKIMVDEFTGQDTGGRYDIARIIMHEDPATAVTIASEMGLDIPRDDEKYFLDELRYIRFRDWLLGCFYPPAPTPEKNKRDMVIDGKVVQYWEKNVDANGGNQGIGQNDWGNLPKIKF